MEEEIALPVGLCGSQDYSLCIYVCMYEKIYNVQFLQPEQSRVRARKQ